MTWRSDGGSREAKSLKTAGKVCVRFGTSRNQRLWHHAEVISLVRDKTFSFTLSPRLPPTAAYVLLVDSESINISKKCARKISYYGIRR